MRLRERLDNIDDLVDLFKEVLKEAQNGVDITVENTGEGTVWQFLHGEIKTLPIKLKVTL